LKNNSIFNHIKNIVIFPGTVVVLIPYVLRNHLPPIHTFETLGDLRPVACFFLILGILLFVSTVFYFWKIGKGTLSPWNRTENLVLRGPYKYVRNPMILSVLCMILGQSIWFQSISIWLWAMFFFLFNHLYFILKEEPDLEKRFGKEYKDYLKTVPRWIPKLSA